MTKNKSPFEIASDVRKISEQSMEQVVAAINSCLQFVQRAVPGNVMGGTELSEKVFSYAERNVASAFEFAEKFLQVKDVRELPKLQIEFIQSQLHVMSEQTKEMSETVTKAVIDARKTHEVIRPKLFYCAKGHHWTTSIPCPDHG